MMHPVRHGVLSQLSVLAPLEQGNGSWPLSFYHRIKVPSSDYQGTDEFENEKPLTDIQLKTTYNMDANSICG